MESRISVWPIMVRIRGEPERVSLDHLVLMKKRQAATIPKEKPTDTEKKRHNERKAHERSLKRKQRHTIGATSVRGKRSNAISYELMSLACLRPLILKCF